VATLRLFVAAHPPEAVCGGLLGELAGLGREDLRPVPAAQVHLTLVFIGNRDSRELDATLASVEASVRGLPAFPLRPVRLVPLPRPGLARTIAAETDRPATLLEIHERLVRRLARNPSPRPRDSFRPHLTLGRFRHEVACELDLPLATAPFRVESVAVLASDLRPDGAVHRELARLTLGG
jgi:2'-5' RNA ligase